MLVLTRKEGEAIVCTLEDGRTIRFEVAEGGPVRVAIEAPRSVAIARAEILAGGPVGTAWGQHLQNP
ncbi:MAG: carbon storage regulator [Actinomycetes bacterium]